ncbi:universal stress protein [Marinobacteraceae bacterium S3BR75-40.1]
MEKRKHILFVVEGLDVPHEQEALDTALTLARDQEAQLSLLVLGAALPEGLGHYQAAFDDFLHERAQQLLERVTTKRTLPDEGASERPAIVVRSGHAPHIQAIQYVLQNGCDLLIKPAEPTTSHKGFRAIDMGLLRKCPIPVLLYRSQKPSPTPIEHIGVAVDPGKPDRAEYRFAQTLLEAGLTLGRLYHADVSVIACWESVAEDYLRNHIFAQIAVRDLQRAVKAEEASHLETLNHLVTTLNADPRPRISHPRGEPEKLIPRFVSDHDIDLLVMGTVARTGIPGFLIGNTAENILQKIGCSLLALKPEDFVSPVAPDS